MVPALLVHEGTRGMKSYPVHIDLLVQCSDDCAGLHAVDEVMEALADADADDARVGDWSVGFDASLGHLDINLTIEADHHADALAYGHELVRRAAARAYATLPEDHPLTIIDSDTEIKVFA